VDKPIGVLVITCLVLVMGTPLYAHQPVMDMAPRWSEGYGFQIRHEFRQSDDLIDKNDKLANPLSLDRKVHTTWLEGIYTFDRSKRVTIKIPWVDKARTTNIGGIAVKQTDHGLGDIILAVPLKLFRNKTSSTYSFGFTPSLRVPSGKTGGDYPIGDGSWDTGLSFNYSSESPKFYQLYDLFYWINTEGDRDQDEGNQLGLDMNWGIHPYHNNDRNTGMFLMFDVTARYKDEGFKISGNNAGTRVSVGPILVLYRGNTMFRAEYKFPVYEYALGSQVSYGNELNVGIGITF